jgi:hypothetical protein
MYTKLRENRWIYSKVDRGEGKKCGYLRTCSISFEAGKCKETQDYERRYLTVLTVVQVAVQSVLFTVNVTGE